MATGIETMKMSIDDVDRILCSKYKIAQKKLLGYSEEIKRGLLSDLESHT